MGSYGTVCSAAVAAQEEGDSALWAFDEAAGTWTYLPDEKREVKAALT